MENYFPHREFYYFLAYELEFGFPGVERLSSEQISEICAKIEAQQPAPMPLDPSFLDRLRQATISAIFCAKYLMTRFPNQKLVYLFGGMSADNPKFLALATRLEIPALCCIGEGEQRLEQIVRVAHSLSDETQDLHSELVGAVSGTYSSLIHSARPEEGRQSYRLQIADLDLLPFPDFDEYFESLRRMTKGAAVSGLKADIVFPIEGTRGCFARCDFCGMNHLWEGFRKSSGSKIIERCAELRKRYRAKRIQFVDNVCDTWAESFADSLVERGEEVHCFMELRAHHPERFWTKLSLAGVDGIQVGIESLSSPLLKKIGKGTTPIQNVSCHKYITEARIAAYANLITHHPASTLEDVAETRRVIEHIPHLPSFGLPRFGLALGSAWYNRLTSEEKTNPRYRCADLLPDTHQSLILDTFSKIPERMRPPAEVERAWDEFLAWYGEFTQASKGRGAALTVRRTEARNELEIRDTRGEKAREYRLAGDLAKIYEISHQGLKLDPIVRRTGISEKRALSAIGELLAERLMIELDGFYLSLAMRPFPELLSLVLPRS